MKMTSQLQTLAVGILYHSSPRFRKYGSQLRPWSPPADRTAKAEPFFSQPGARRRPARRQATQNMTTVIALAIQI